MNSKYRIRHSDLFDVLARLVELILFQPYFLLFATRGKWYEGVPVIVDDVRAKKQQ